MQLVLATTFESLHNNIICCDQKCLDNQGSTVLLFNSESLLRNAGCTTLMCNVMHVIQASLNKPQIHEKPETVYIKYRDNTLLTKVVCYS